MNQHLLVSDAQNFSVEFEINPYMSTADQPDSAAAIAEHVAIVAAHKAAGRTIEYLPTVAHCPDMIYTANAALTRGKKAVLADLPKERQPELPHYRRWLESQGFEVIPSPYLFSGQGDALPCGNLLLAGTEWRTDIRTHAVLRDVLGYEVVSLHTVNARWYDIDIAIAVIHPQLIAYCPEAFDAPSQRIIADLPVEKIPVTLAETSNFALNLVSDGSTITMSEGAPGLAAALREREFKVIELKTTELKKGGGGIRCTSLTLDNA